MRHNPSLLPSIMIAYTIIGFAEKMKTKTPKNSVFFIIFVIVPQ
ncbi:hypothetical protein B4110_3026 [Parageobacillus toebii]|uniref:Uncharacterized protein n=1 Tax=Parageobacillus toebii TaxID=153151 RepID=A0A150N3Y7_9BACL|nr:hypothetical protein B4110_3026 [Parageobacillus toebii]